jgi:hypothetical protein
MPCGHRRGRKGSWTGRSRQIDSGRAATAGRGPVSRLSPAFGPADVETVLVGGEFAKRDGTLVGPHAAKARDLMHETQHRLRAATRAAIRTA